MRQTNKSVCKDILKGICMLGLSVGCFYVGTLFGSSSEDLADVATNVTGTLGSVAKLITGISYIAGLGFAVGAILKFKAHKDNPTQIPVGTPVALLFVAVALVFLPTILGITGETLFDEAGVVGGPSGCIFESSGACN